MEDFRNIPLANLRPPRVLLRSVNKRSVAYLEMRDTIADPQCGLMNSIAVRPTKEPDVFEIIDGYYRFSCCEHLGWETIPCIVKHDWSDERVLAGQVRANAIRPETKPAEFAAQLKRLQILRPDITASVISRMVGKSVQWVKNHLSLNDLSPQAQLAVDRDEMPLGSAYMLAKVPSERVRAELLQQAISLPPREFKALAAGVIRQVMVAMRDGQLEKWFTKEFKPTAFLKPVKLIVKELETGQVGTKTVLKAGLRTPIEGWKKALEWAANLDREALEKQQKNATKRQRKQTLERSKHHAQIDKLVPDPDSSVSDSNI